MSAKARKRLTKKLKKKVSTKARKRSLKKPRKKAAARPRRPVARQTKKSVPEQTATEPSMAQIQALTISRVFDAPRERVWIALTEPSSIMKWWGPREFTSPSCTVDFRVDGKYLFCMRSPEGKDYWSTGVYREIVPLERIVYSDSFSDEQGNVVPASYYGMPDMPGEMNVVLSLEDVEGKTRMTLRHEGMPEEMMNDASAGWNGSFDKLEASLQPEEITTEPGENPPSM